MKTGITSISEDGIKSPSPMTSESDHDATECDDVSEPDDDSDC